VSAAADRIEDVRALEALGLEQLRSVWRRRIGPPPKIRSPDLLRLALAWRLQAAVHGGLDAATRRRLRGSAPVGSSDNIASGVRLVKTWRGETYEVVREGDAYVWDGRSFASLSAVALAITGVKHNGPRFFGMRGAEAVAP